MGTTGRAHSQCSLNDHQEQDTDPRDPPRLSIDLQRLDLGISSHPLQSFGSPLESGKFGEGTLSVTDY